MGLYPFLTIHSEIGIEIRSKAGRQYFTTKGPDMHGNMRQEAVMALLQNWETKKGSL